MARAGDRNKAYWSWAMQMYQPSPGLVGAVADGNNGTHRARGAQNRVATMRVVRVPWQTVARLTLFTYTRRAGDLDIRS